MNVRSNDDRSTDRRLHGHWHGHEQPISHQHRTDLWTTKALTDSCINNHMHTCKNVCVVHAYIAINFGANSRICGACVERLPTDRLANFQPVAIAADNLAGRANATWHNSRTQPHAKCTFLQHNYLPNTKWL